MVEMSSLIILSLSRSEGEICFSPSIRLFGVLNQCNQATHLVARLTRVHQMRENVAVEGIDTSRGGPGIEGEIKGLAWRNRDRIHLLCLW